MTSRWCAALLLLAVFAFGQQPTTTGTVLAISGGPSGHSAGELRLLAGNAVLTIVFQKPIKSRFTQKTCWYPGSIWTATLRHFDGSGGELASASCSGVNDRAFAAVSVVKEFLLEIADSRFEDAYAESTKRFQRSHPFRQFEREFSRYNFFLFAHGNGGTCLSIQSSDFQSLIPIYVPGECGIRVNSSNDIDEFLFGIIKEPHSSKWKIESVQRSALGPGAPVWSDVKIR